MDKNQSLRLAAVIFGIIALLQSLRSIFSWTVSIAGWNVPIWFSYVAVLVAGCLAWHMWSVSKS